MITRINSFQAVPGKAKELFQFLQSLLPYITGSDGCLSCEVLRHHESENDFVVIEKWESIDMHTKSVKEYPKQDMQAILPLLAAPPAGNYYRPK